MYEFCVKKLQSKTGTFKHTEQGILNINISRKLYFSCFLTQNFVYDFCEKNVQSKRDTL